MKKNIAVIGGGNSSEYVISIQSAAQICKMLDEDKYNAFPVSIVRDDWHIESEAFNNAVIDRADFSFIFNGEKIKFDFAYITIHGTPGEDGLLPAYFELLGIPHSTCDVLVSSMTFDKFFCKKFLQQLGVAAAKDMLVKKGDAIDVDQIVQELGLPVFVKPTHGGSSFGVTRVTRKDEIKDAILKSFAEDPHDVLIESELKGTEVTCGVINTSGEAQALLPTEIVSHNDFFDYQAKYEGHSEEITPARISAADIKKCQDTSIRINKMLNCKGITRTDFIFREGEFYFIEINTVPGMSSASIVPQQVAAMGMTMKDVFTRVIEDAMAR